MNTVDPIRSAAIKSQQNVHEAVGSLAEIHSMRTGLSNSIPVAPGYQARKDAQAFSESVREIFSASKYEGFRAKVNDIERTVDYLSSTKVSSPRQLISNSLLTVREEMTAIMIQSDKKPDQRLAKVVSAFANLERSGTAYAMHEHKERAIAAINEHKSAEPGGLLRSALAMPSPAPGKKHSTLLGLG